MQYPNLDRYNKGAWLLHTLRLSIADDPMFFGLIKGFYEKYRYKTCTSDDFVNFVNSYLGKDMSRVIEQYLHHPSLPTLEYDLEQMDSGDIKIKCRWRADVKGFDMPVVVGTVDQAFLLRPVTGEIKEGVLSGINDMKAFRVSDGLFFVEKKRL